MEERYARLLQQYLQGEQEREEILYQLSLLGTRFIAAGYGPEDVVALHSEALEHLPDSVQADSDWALHSMDFLVEVMIAYGVRHREQIQYEMEESQRQAEQRAAIAVAEAEERLRLNRQRLQDRDDFVGFIAHELRRPLTTIQGRATLGQRYVQHNPKAQENFNAIYQAAKQMGDTLDLLLQLSRQERDYSLTDTSTVPVAQLLHESVDEFQVEQRIKELSLTVDIEPPEPVVQGDEAGLRTVFANLVSNAIKYNKQGGAVMIRTRHLRDWVQIEVEDTGVGIPADELPHIFNRYYRIKTAGERPHGSGLGLALVEYIVHQHGGNIAASSEEGIGSRFIVQLPYYQSRLSPDGEEGREW
ncbi:MAG: ATP-binding protein [Chloroflexota bacterium]|nr:ATP-binding protein [Chloroflexota bacterium]